MPSFNFSPFPELFTERLLLREITSADIKEVFQLRSDINVMQFIDRPLAQSMNDAVQLIQKIKDGHEKNENITWAITLQNQPELIGTIGFWRIDKENYRAEIGYLLHPGQQGKGLMQEAVEMVLKYGFQTMKLHSVEANVNPANNSSIKLLKKNKFVKEAHYKENYFYDGKFLDSAVYSLLSDQ
jgi:ribosomal-protein-alanine N-acetyltransferase